MHYLTVSFSHKNSDITAREKLAFTETSKEEALATLTCEDTKISEAIIVSTCNRVEILASTNDTAKASTEIFEMLSRHSGLSIEELEGRADVFENEGAVHHLFAVTSSLDSVVIGETQIAGQIKDAFKFAYDRGHCSQKLSRVMHYAFKCAADVRNQTEIAKKPISVASVAVDKAKKLFGKLDGEIAVVIGTGEMGEIACKYLLTNGANVILVSRSKQKADEMGEKLGKNVTGADFGAIKELLNTHKLVFSATGAQHPIITDELVEERDFYRAWFDISVPRDIDVKKRDNLEVVTVDDLKDIVEQNQMLRAEEARIAYTLVGSYTMDFFKWIGTLSVDPIIKELREKAQLIAEKEIKNAVKKGFITKEHEEDVLKVLHSAFKKFMHDPTVNLKALANSPGLDTMVESLKYLHNLSSEAKIVDRYKCEYTVSGIDEGQD
jgi:glutamyl-tRNA reductase